MSEALGKATLGRTGLDVTRLGYGAMELRGTPPRGRPVSDEQAGVVLNTVLDEGITFIDTADCYGRSEEFIGKHISHRREEYRLATKCGCTPDGKVWTRDHLFEGLNRSLKRLKTDYVDVMQLHGATPDQCQQEGCVEVLEEMREQGKVRWIGASTYLDHLPTYIDWDSFDTFQLPYSGFSRDLEDLIGVSSKAGMGTIIRGGVAKGEPGEGRGTDERWSIFDEAGLNELRDPGESRTSFMLRFTLSHPGVNTIIVGSQNPDHIRQNVQAALRGSLSADTYAEAQRRLSNAGVEPAPSA